MTVIMVFGQMKICLNQHMYVPRKTKRLRS